MLFHVLADASKEVAATSRRNEKVDILASVLAEVDDTDVEAAVAFLVGTTPHGRIGVGWAALSETRPDPAPVATLTITDVSDAVDDLASVAGPGSEAQRRRQLDDLFGRATASEQRLLVGLLGGELRQGAGDGVVTSAVAKAAGLTVAAVRRAAMFAGDLGVAAVAALSGDAEAVDAITLEPGRPVQPMLASTSPSVAEALADTVSEPESDTACAAAASDAASESESEASIEWKLDGARIQAHRRDGVVSLYTRNLNDVTGRLPTVVEQVRSLPGGDLVLDGEVLGMSDEGPRAFQDTIGDFAADAPDHAAPRGGSLRAWFFDVMFADGRPVVDDGFAARRSMLHRIVPESGRVPSILTSDAEVAQQFFADTIAAGHEGVMVKDLRAPYEAGRRGAGWRKVKPVHTLDLVVLAVEWGSGRRRGWLSNIHLGARSASTTSADAPSFVMVGKTFKGMTDDILRWQTERFLELQIDAGDPAPWERHRGVVRVRPEQVVEIAVDGVQRSTTYPGGVALRFARVKGYRSDKGPGEADTIDAVRAML